MLMIYCFCGQRLEATDSEQLFQCCREHVRQNHPEKPVSDEQIWAVIKGNAHDTHKVEQIRQQGA